MTAKSKPKPARKMRWTITVVDRPVGDQPFVTENEMYMHAQSRLSFNGRFIVEKVEVVK